MTQTVAMRAPVAGGTYVAKSGTTYTADINQMITGVPPGDIESLTNSGCIIVSQRAIVTPVVSSYVVQGAVNFISSSTSADAFTLAAPGLIGETTKLVNRSTGVPVITSSGCEVVTSSGGVCTVLTGTTKGAIDLESINSSQYQVGHRSGGTSSAGAAFVFNIASS